MEVVISASSIISPLGTTLEEFSGNLFQGHSAVMDIRKDQNFVDPQFPVPYAAILPREKLPSSQYFRNHKELEDLPKSWLLTALATERVLENVSRETEIDAVYFGSADGVHFERVLKYFKNGFSNWNPLHTQCESSLLILHEVLLEMGFPPIKDENLISLNAACATGNQALGIAFQNIRSGKIKRCLVGGVDARCEPSNLLNFHSLGALTTVPCPAEKASRPFSKDRTGFVRGEGACFMLVESMESALARGAPIMGKISGYSCTSDAYRLTDGREDAECILQAMKKAIENANIKLEDIDYISAHGTGTPLNDRLETLAIKKLFQEGAYKIPISSLKSQIGHSTIAAGSIEALACLLMLKEQRIAPTINYNIPDPECDLDFVPNISRRQSLQYILSNSFGFGGQNACIVLGNINSGKMDSGHMDSVHMDSVHMDSGKMDSGMIKNGRIVSE